MKVSIVIPTYNEERYIANCLISIQNQDYNDYEVLVVDNGSNDSTRDVVKLFKKVKLLSQTEMQSAGASKNLGVEKAVGDIIVFIDADEVIGNDFIKKLIEPIENGKAIATCPYHCINERRVDFVKGIFRAVRRDKFPRFDTRKGYADDQVDNLEIMNMDIPLFHIITDTVRKSYFKGKWVGQSFEYADKKSFMSKIIYKFGLLVGLFQRQQDKKVKG